MFQERFESLFFIFYLIIEPKENKQPNISNKVEIVTKPRLSTISSQAKRTSSTIASVKKTSITSTSNRRLTTSNRTSTIGLPASKRPKVTTSISSSELQGRMMTMENVTKGLQEQISLLTSLSREKDSQIQQEIEVKTNLEQNVSMYTKEIEESQNRHKELIKIMDESEARHRTDMQNQQAKLTMTQSKLESNEMMLKMANSDLTRLQTQYEEKVQEAINLESQLKQLKQSLSKSESIAAQQQEKIEKLEESNSSKNELIAELEAKSIQDEDVRRALHNTIQELKGNIRVFCRIRPTEEIQDDSIKYSFNKMDDGALEITQRQSKDVTGCKNAPDKKFSFHFDKVFQSNSTQANVFSEISQLVQSALDGYNTCIFAYGQTGSGKTYTMEGPEPDYLTSDTEGMISRAVRQIFFVSNQLKEKGWSYEMHASFLEIYNETIHDLLDSKSSDKKCDVKHDPESGTTSVTNLHVVRVKNPDKVHELLQLASSNRAVASTKMNERSSRSHSVFQLRLVGKNSITSASVEGLLNLIDLAGSERLTTSGASGDRLIETRNINKSLSCLGDVISALANKDKHIPYRNSKLTYLLQSSLGGNGKTLMFVNVSPTPENFNESINSLRFASKVNACEIGTARKGGKIDLGN